MHSRSTQTIGQRSLIAGIFFISLPQIDVVELPESSGHAARNVVDVFLSAKHKTPINCQCDVDVSISFLGRLELKERTIR